MAEVIKLKIDNPKIKRTTRAKSDASTKVLEKGELLGIRNTDGTFTLKLGDGITEVRSLQELKSGGGTGDLSKKQDLLVETLDITAANVELDSQKFSLIRTSGHTNRNITFKNPLIGYTTTPEYNAEIEFEVSTENVLNFPTGTIIRSNDTDLKITNNIVKVTPTVPKKVQLRAQNGVVLLTNPTISSVISGIEDYLQDLITLNTTETNLNLLSKNYTKITADNNVNISLEATSRVKIYRGTIKFNDVSSAKDFILPTNINISTNDSSVIIDGNKATINKTDEYYFVIYDDHCDLININLTQAVPTKISQLNNDSGYIKKNDLLKIKTTGKDLYLDGYAVIEETGDIELTLTDKYIGDISSSSSKLKSYDAYIKLEKNKKIILPSSVKNIKTNDDENIEIGSNYILAKYAAEIELTIRGENCFAFVWSIEIPHYVELVLNNCKGELKQVSGEMILKVVPDTGYALPEESEIILEHITLKSYDKATGIMKFDLPDEDARITINAIPPEIFTTDTWENVAAKCDALEAGSITEAQFISYFDNGSGKITSMDGFVGLERKVQINSVEHTVRVLGTQHDTISGGTTKAALTFQLVELFSDSTGAKITQKFNASYASPYYNIWNDGTQSCDIRNYLRGTFKGYLPSEVQSAIKTIKKKTSAGNTSTTVNELDEDIFLLSFHELCSEGAIDADTQSTMTTEHKAAYKQEGIQYKFFADRLPDTDPYNWDSALDATQKAIVIKKDKSGAASRWWLRSPDVAYSDYAFYVYGTGFVSNVYVVNAYGVAPAFCI